MSDRGSADPPADVKPKGDGAKDENTLNIKIVSNDGNEVFFKIKKTTKLNKLKAAYSERVGADPSALRLLYDGQRILDHHTAQDLGLEDEDSIEVLLEQVGGSH